jgi:hypothetical protein
VYAGVEHVPGYHPAVGGNARRSAAADRRARGDERRERAEARRREQIERRAKRDAWRVVRRARFVAFHVCEEIGFLPITKRQARTLIDRLGSRLLVRTTRDGDCAGLERSPF